MDEKLKEFFENYLKTTRRIYSENELIQAVADFTEKRVLKELEAEWVDKNYPNIGDLIDQRLAALEGKKKDGK